MAEADPPAAPGRWIITGTGAPADARPWHGFVCMRANARCGMHTPHLTTTTCHHHHHMPPGFAGAARKQVKDLVAGLGGTYEGDLQQGRTTHLLYYDLAAASTSAKLKTAAEWGLPCVHWTWLLESARAGKWLDLVGGRWQEGSSAGAQGSWGGLGRRRARAGLGCRQGLGAVKVDVAHPPASTHACATSPTQASRSAAAAARASHQA